MADDHQVTSQIHIDCTIHEGTSIPISRSSNPPKNPTGATAIPAQINSRIMDNPNSQYYLHYGENTGTQLISVLLSDENYSTWSRAITMALSVKNKEGFMDGTISKLDLNDLLFIPWRRCNHVVSACIINSIPKELYPSVMHKDSAREIWL
ncbi:Hypothetical predicted protein [Olea europaea subsp. europaea]|uniref:Retrotransposon Copia-like N-terminal domain-containing protein n=1 Tax=Olea europaea subsp. europaea TaxID=158383 RepID=A0A8S0V1L6_OLEEU|nr:Hypothetical predicted protein [Olea europaea subsp. europaea]